MKLSSLICRLTAAVLILSALLPFAACTGEGDVTTDESSSTADISDVTEAPGDSEKRIELVADGKLTYTVVRPDVASALNIRAASHIRSHAKDNDIEASLSDWGEKDINAPEILVGDTKFFPEEAIADIPLDGLGVDGFVIKVYEGKIIIASNNDKALIGATKYFTDNFLDIKGGKTSMPENYCYIYSNGSYLTSLTLGGADISEFALSCDAGLEEPMSYIKELVLEKTGHELNAEGEKKITLTTAGAQDGKVAAKLEGGNLVITAKDAEAMKKAVVCFWYENIGHTTGTCELPADLNYGRNLAQVVFYSDFDVKQSENECCMDSLIAAHNYANENGFKVFADYGAKYYISSTGKTVTVKTDVEWGNSQIIIDDSGVSNGPERGNWIFHIPAGQPAYNINTVKTINRGMTNLGITLPQKSFVTFVDNTEKIYIRSGGNANSGTDKVDNIVVDADGTIDPDAPIMWDFDNITSITVRPIDETVLTVSGGTVTTIANKAPSEYAYYARGILINRSNTVIDSVVHLVTGEGATGAPYNGFVQINSCAYVTVKNCVFTGHKTYKSSTTKMGSYDIGMGHSISVSFVNCTQSNDITDDKYWGVSGTNFCKNFVYDGCILSRFDAHMGVTNAMIRNSVIGHAGATVIGYGTLLIEDSVFFSNKMLTLRTDYGSSWEGDIIIKNSTLCANSGVAYVIAGSNKGNHDYGYECHMPTNVIIEGLTVDKAKTAYVFANLNSNCKSESYVPQFPYIITKKVEVSGANLELKLCENEFLCTKTEFVQK